MGAETHQKTQGTKQQKDSHQDGRCYGNRHLAFVLCVSAGLCSGHLWAFQGRRKWGAEFALAYGRGPFLGPFSAFLVEFRALLALRPPSKTYFRRP